MFDAREIALALGGKRNGLAWVARCPAHADRTPSLSLRDHDGKVLVHCHGGCPQVAVLDRLRGLGLWPDTPMNGHASMSLVQPITHRQRDDVEARTRRALRWWREAEDPRGTLAERYLLSRELVLDENLANHVLRFHRRCLFGQDEAENAVFHPCLVVLFRDISTDRPRSIHRIALVADGSDRLGKKMLGPTAGCAVKLDDDGEVTRSLNVAEGIETALARYAEGDRPIWALGSSGALERFPVLAGVESLVVWADNDASMTGFRAAKACINRWAAAGRKAHGIMPKGVDCDWADERGVR